MEITDVRVRKVDKERKMKEMEHSVKVYLIGAAAVIVSGVKLEDWQRAEQFAPEALRVMNEDGEPAFRIMTAKGSGSMNELGVVWGSYLNEEGNPTVTILIDDEVDDRRAAVMEVIGSALLKLEEIEQKMPEILQGIGEKEKEFDSHLVEI